jgi:hypothetical protein
MKKSTKREASPYPPMNNPPQKTKWLLLVINITFVVSGLVLLPTKPDVGIVTLALFGSCLVTTIAFQWQRHLDHIFRVQTVEVVGGVKIKPRRRIIYIIGGWLVALGAVMYVYSGSYPLIFQWLCLLLVAIGAGSLAAALAGFLPRGSLQFDPEGLTIDQGSWSVQIPWDEIDDVTLGEYLTNPVVGVDMKDDEVLTILPTSKGEKALKHMAFNRTMLGVPFMLFPMHYGIPSLLLAAAIEQYCKSKNARAGLRLKAIGHQT